MSWLKKNLTKLVVFGVAGACVIAVGAIFLKSRLDYQAYLKQYEKDAEAIKGKFAMLPEEVFADNEYVTYANGAVTESKSSFANNVVFGAREAVVKPLSDSKAQTYVTVNSDGFTEVISGLDRMGGSISFTINTEDHGMSDIDIVMRTNRLNEKGVYNSYPNITDFIKIQINKLEVKTKDIELPQSRDVFTHLILKNTNLIQGENTLTITTSAYNDYGNKNDYLYVMPDIRNVTFLSDVNMSKASNIA